MLGDQIVVTSPQTGAFIGELEGGLIPAQQGGYDWRGVLIDAQTGARYPVLFHINH